jgi:N6-adenosine-specific RNA methylase IME4
MTIIDTERNFKIDNEFSKYIPGLSSDEYEQLKSNIHADGCREPLVIWEEEGLLVDGHNRFRICTETNVPYDLQKKSFPDRESVLDWIDCNQLGRRNLSPTHFNLLLGRRYNRMKKKTGAPFGNDNATKQIDQNDPIDSTAEKLSKQHNVSPATVKRAGKLAKAVEKIAVVAPEFNPLNEKQQTVIAAAHVIEKMPDEAPDIIAKGEKEILDKDRELKAEKRINKQAENDSKDVSDVAREDNEMNDVYEVVVIDLTKFLQKRGLNKIGIDHVAMKESELAIPCATDCHVWAWTTHRYLPVAFQLLKKWGLQYEFTFVWQNPEGEKYDIQPLLNCEFAIYAKKGSPKFIDTEPIPVCFSAPCRNYSEKPEEFFEMIRKLTSGRRLTMFQKQKINGFDLKDAA